MFRAGENLATKITRVSNVLASDTGKDKRVFHEIKLKVDKIKRKIYDIGQKISKRNKKDKNTPKEACFVKVRGLAREVIKLSNDHDRSAQKNNIVTAPIEVSYWLTFLCASFVGLHLAHQLDDGTYKVCKLRIVAAGVLYIVSYSLALFTIVYIYVNNLATYGLIVIIASNIFGSLYTIIIWGIVLSNSCAMMEYMEDIKEAGLTVKPDTKACYYIVIALLYTLLTAFINFFLLPFPTNYIPFLAAPLILNCLVPSLIDKYMCSFVVALYEALEKLDSYVREVGRWRLADVEAVAAAWLTISRLVGKHNQVFSQVNYMRMTQFTCQIMVLLYLLIQLHDTCCLWILLSLSLPLVEALLKSLTVSFVGDKLLSAHERVENSLREAIASSASLLSVHCGREDGHEHEEERGHQDELHHEDEHDYEERGQALNDLISRLEARPINIAVWGMERLGSGTWMELMGAMVTYLFMLVQLRTPEVKYQNMSCSSLLLHTNNETCGDSDELNLY